MPTPSPPSPLMTIAQAIEHLQRMRETYATDVSIAKEHNDADHEFWAAQNVDALDTVLARLQQGEREICICAAIRFKDGSVIRGHRHDSCYKTAMGIPALNDYLHQAEQGFVTSRNRFVDRGTAWCLQRDAGMVSADPGGYHGEILFSEDLY